MKARYLKDALELVPDDAEILVASDEMGCDIPLKDKGGFKYFRQTKAVWLILEDDEPIPDSKAESTWVNEGGAANDDDEENPPFDPTTGEVIDAEYRVIDSEGETVAPKKTRSRAKEV